MKSDLIEKIAMTRRIIPDIALRTTLISGFPGETIEQHRECVEFVSDMKFDRLGVFPYSREEGTPAAEFDGQLPEETKREWADELMEAQQEVIFRQNEEFTGRRLSVIVDGYLPEEEVYVARSYRDAPDIDGCVFFPSAGELLSGDIVAVRITGAKGYDLIGEICCEEEN